MPPSRIGEDILSTLFASLDDLLARASKINKRIVYTLYLLIIWLIVEMFLWATSIVTLELDDIVLYTVLLFVTFLVLISLLEIRESMAVVVSRYSSYKYMENLSIDIPKGNDPVDRLILYFNKTLNFEEEIKRRKGRIIRNVEIDCGEKIRFDYYAEIRVGKIKHLLGHRSYSFYVRKENKLNLKTVEKFANDVKRCSNKNNIPIGRAVIVAPAQEISDELYEYLVENRAEIPLQIAIEMEDGTYDFIPFIAPRHDMLP